MTHLAPCHAEFLTQHPKTLRAYCGKVVQEVDLARDGNPTCAECKAIDEQDTKDLAALQATTARAKRRPADERTLAARRCA
jgi:hypothetical protein